MRYLLDTNVVSELRRRQGDSGVKAWVRSRSAADLAISVITVIEIETGILRVERRDPRQGSLLRRWLEDSVLTGFADRIIPLDLAVARHVARLHVPDAAPQHDAQIAATALAHDLTVATRNTKDFERCGVDLLNPWLDGG